MNRWLKRAMVSAFLLALVSGPARAWKIADLETEVAALKSRMDELEQREEKYRKEVDDAKKQQQDSNLQIRKDQADLKAELEELKQQVTSLEEMLRELSDKLTALDQKASANSDALASLQNPPAAEPASETKEAGVGADIYNQALDSFKAKKYEVARAQFEAFLKANPNDPYSDNALFWIGETYYSEKNYKYAINEYARVQEKYPQGNKVPAALYKIGLCFEQLKKIPEASAMYKQLIEAFPASEEAAKAKGQLEKLSSKTK